MKKVSKAIATIIISFSMISVINLNVKTTAVNNFISIKDNNLLYQIEENQLELSDEQDGRFIKKLEWVSPNGELPGTYDEYSKIHPLSSAFFSEPLEYLPNLQSNINKISILVDTVLYFLITNSLEQYIDDLNAEGYSVTVQKVTGGSPNDIKTWIINRYNQGDTGFVFIGNITAAWAEVSGDVFPCDLFYMDLDGNWEDRDYDGDYEIHTAGNGDMGPEVFVGRIYAHTLNYDTEFNMVNNYLSKTHLYRIGELTQPWRGLEYVDEDWYDMDVFLRLVYGDDVFRYDSGYDTTAEDYLDQMMLGQNFVQVCAHSYSGGHHFGTRPTKSASYENVYVYCPSTRPAKLLLGSDDGVKVWLNSVNVYTNDRYGGWSEDAFEVNVTLNEGWNQLLCKVSQDGGDYMFSLRFCDMSYNTFNDLIYQINNPEIHTSEADFIRSWLLNGFHQDDPDNFWNYLTTNYLGVNEATINPVEGQVMGGKTWTCYDSGYPYINLGEYCNNADYGACYAFVRIYAQTSISCQLWMGYDDGARVWLNGAEALYDNRYGGFEGDMTKINVTLSSGENRLLIKISEWMGDHGFSARLCNSDGSAVEGVSYDPIPVPISHIGTWLINGPYYNSDTNTRLSMDYLGNESIVTPSEGDPAIYGTWKRGLGNGRPFNLGSFFDSGGWVLSQDIQNLDPPVLFYNLFACGPGRFTDENYLAGAYIFNTTYGLITVASSKSGSMLNFDDFTQPLSEGKSLGEAYRIWFDAQAPFQQWEKEWYYGMVLCGDPTLLIITNGHPEKPILDGPTNGKPKREYEFNIVTTDPDADDVYYYVDWGDDKNSGWIGPCSSGDKINVSHSWSKIGNYSIKARANDTNGLLSPWTELPFSIPRSRSSYEILFLYLLKRFSYTLPILRYLFTLQNKTKLFFLFF
jgi:hypothetical protein